MSKVLIAAAWFALLATAQDFRATLTGRVSDSSGASIPNAPVSLVNRDTGEVLKVLSSSGGSYTIPFLRPGSYSLSVEFAGFRKFVRDGINLNLGQTAVIDVALEVGSQTEQVTVTAETPMLDTAKADRGTVINNQRVTDLPLNARNPFMLSALVAGVNYNGNAIYQRPFDNGSIAEWGINGSRSRKGEFLLDGAPNNSQAGDNNIAYVPPVDSVQEFKIMTNTYDAQYGKTGGGIVNVTLKSGTNGWHGTVYEFMRRTALDAASFQNNARGIGRGEHYLDQYGVQFSGPVILPGIYNGRNRTFFMTNYEGYREGSPNPTSASVPAPEFLQGDFSNLRNALGQQIRIYDPLTGRDAGGGNWVREPFPGNIIPANRINPIARRILSYYPQPNTTSPSLDYAQGNLFISPNVSTDSFYNFTFKVDQNLGDRHRFFFRHASNDRTERRVANGVTGVGEDGALPSKRVNDAYVVDWVSTVTPSLLLNVRLSFSRYNGGSAGNGNAGFNLSDLGFPRSLEESLPVTGYFGRYQFSDYTSLGRYINLHATNTTALHPALTAIRGAHTFKAGVDARVIQYNLQNSGNVFQLNFSRQYTQQQFNRADQLSGNSIASALLGAPSGGQVQWNTFPSYTFGYYAPYLQDDWKVSRRLTLNLGIRWDLNLPPTERYNQMNSAFDTSVVSPVNSLVDRRRFPDLPELRGALTFAGVEGRPRRSSAIDWNNFQPRIGVAYVASDNLVLRGGFGTYYMNPNNDYLQRQNFDLATPLVHTLDSGRTPINGVLNNPYPEIMRPPGASTGALTLVGRGMNFVNPTFRIPYVHQFSAGFQYQLPWRSVVEVSYVGNRTFDLEVSRDFNYSSSAQRAMCNPLEGGSPLFCDQQVANPWQNLEPFRGLSQYSASQVSRGSLFRPYPHFGDITELMRNEGRIWYNSMQITYDTRNWHGLNLNLAYTLSKTIERAAYTDAVNNVMPNTLAANDRPHRVTINGLYELPFGRGKKLINTSNGVLNRIVSGWQANAMFTWQSGTPWQLPSNVIYLREAKIDNIDWSAPVVQGVRPCVLRMADDGRITPQSFSVAYGCGTDPSTYNFLIQPRYAPRVTPDRDGRLRLHTVGQADLSLIKNTNISERVRLQFRAEAFNVTNTYSFYRQNFNNNPENANFGAIVKGNVAFDNSNFPRHVQLALKLIF